MAETATLICPKCRGEMRTYERNGVLIDQCEECRGIFQDRGSSSDCWTQNLVHEPTTTIAIATIVTGTTSTMSATASDAAGPAPCSRDCSAANSR